MKPMMLGPSRFNDGIPLATDTETDGDYDVLNIADQKPNKKHKFASAGTRYYTVDCGSAKTADAFGIRTHNLFNANASVSVEKGDRTVEFSDSFNNGSFDTGNFGLLVSGGGTGVETTVFTLDSTIGPKAAAVYDKNPLSARTSWWETAHHYKQVESAAPGAPVIMLYESASIPALGSAQFLDRTELRACIYQFQSFIGFVYRDTGGTCHYWNGSGSAWVTGAPTPACASALDTEYIARLYGDEINMIFELWDSAGTTLLARASIALSSIQQDGDTDYFVFGDMNNSSLDAVKMVSTLWERATVGFSQALAPFTPANDLAFLKIFSSASARYWRVKIVSSTVAVYVGAVFLGDRLEWPKPPEGGYAPTHLKNEGWTNRSKLKEALGKGGRGNTRKARMKYKSIDRVWLLGTFLPLYKSYYSKNCFLFCWNLDDPYADVLFGWVPEGYEFKDPMTVMERVDNFIFDIEGRQEGS